MEAKRHPRLRRLVWQVLLGFVILVVVLLGLSAASNMFLVTRSAVTERLSDVEKARLAEAVHLRKAVGERVWPGWGTADIPVMLYNEEFAFLAGCADPEKGWIKVPQGISRGQEWEAVPDETLLGSRYYRQRLPASGQTPQCFTVRVGDQWVASMNTWEWMQISLRKQIRKELPKLLAPVVPLSLIKRVLLNSTDWYLSALLHECFHAFQGFKAPDRLADAEKAVTCEDRYPWTNPKLADLWQKELDLLARAAAVRTQQESLELARRFLALRDERRQVRTLSAEFVDYEERREWLEGLAKYVELEVWRQAAQPDYQPSLDRSVDSEFESYRGFQARWNQELTQIRWSTNSRDVRFYYSGFAQAILLDRLRPGWKTEILVTGSPESLLRRSVSNND